MEIKVPTNINDIPLSEYQRYAKVNIEDADKEFLLHKTIEIFCEMDIRDVAKLPIRTATDLLEEINSVLEQDAPHTRRMVLEGREYGFIPDLAAMTLGEYVDLEDGIKDVSQFHKAIAVLYRPIVKQHKDLYTIEPYSASPQAHELMKSAPFGEVSAALVFFYRIAKELSQASPRYLKTMEEKNKTTLEEVNSTLSTDGLTASMHLLKEEPLTTVK